MKNPCRFVAAIATLSLVAGAAFAQTPSRAMKAPKGNGQGDSGTSGNTLYSDPCNNAQYGFASQDFADFASFSCRTYDDASVADGTSWCVAGFCTDGFFNYSPHTPNSLKFEIVRDAGGLPDCGNNFFAAEIGSDATSNAPDCLGLPDGKFTYCPGGTVTTLSAGTWWFTAAVNMPFASPVFNGQWYWVGSTTPHRNGGSPYLDNPGGGFGLPPCFIWTSLGLDQDLAFNVFGDVCGGCDCSLRAGNTDTGGGGSPADTLSVDGSAGDSCREVTVDGSVSHTLAVASAPSVGKGQYGVWVYDGNDCSATTLVLTGGKGTFVLGSAPRCLPVNNTGTPGSCPCPVTFPTGRTSKALGSGTATALCLNKKPGFPKSPTTFAQSFPSGGTYQVQGLVQDLNSVNSPAKNIGISNAVVVNSL